MYEKRHPLALRDFVRNKVRLHFPIFDEACYSDTKQGLIEKFSAADAVLMAPGRFLDDEVHKVGKNIKLIQVWSSGYDKINLDACRKFNQRVANNGGANAQSVAEHTILLMLSAARRLSEMHNRVIFGEWEGNGHGLNLQSLFDKQLGIIGLGNIGSKVAELASSFKMRVVYYDPFVETGSSEKFTKVNLQKLLETSDFISLHTHALRNVRPILGREEFSLIKLGANLINTSRAELIDFPSLMSSLQSGKLRYYAADVFYDEPTTGQEIELSMINTTFTPHIAGSNLETYEIALENCLTNIRRALNGQEIFWEVTKF